MGEEDGSYIEVHIDENEYTPKKSLKDKLILHRKKIIIILFVLISLLIISGVVALMVTTLVKCDKGYESVLYLSSDEILNFDHNLRNTTEMQIELSNFDDWIDRNAQMDAWIAAMNEKSKYLDTTYAVITDRVREQYELQVSECDSHTYYRVREYTEWEDGKGEVTIDSKYNDKDMIDACTSPMAPAEKYKAYSFEKCELDLHECSDDDKYSREGRIHFAEGTYTSPSTCSDMVNLYPGDFAELSSSKMNNPVTKKSSSYWFERKYIGYMDDTKYEITFTLSYHNIEKATIGNEQAPDYGEWSLRTYSIGDGFTDTWNEDVVKDSNELYDYMKNTFGEPGCE